MKIQKYDFGTLEIGDHFIVGEMKEGADIHLDVVSRIIDIANEAFNGERWGYISNRINSYSLNPIVHMEAPEFEKNMVVFAVVTNKDTHRINAELEKSFSDEQYKFECFLNLETAIAWVTQVLTEE